MGSIRIHLQIVNNQRGDSLIQTLIAMSIMAIMAVAFTSMMSSQQKQIKFLESKQDVISVRNSLTRVYARNPGFCAAANTALGDIKFPIASVPTQITFNKIFESPTVELMSIANGIRETTLLNVGSLEFKNFAGTGDNYTADLVVNITQKDTSMIALKPITFPNMTILTQTDPGNPSLKQIIGCSATGLMSGADVPVDLKQKRCHLTGETGGPPGTNRSCNANEYAAGIYMIATGGGDVDLAALLCCSADESSFDGFFSQTTKYWTSYSGGSPSNPYVMCSAGYFASGMECNYSAPGDADQCRLQCSRVEDTAMRANFNRVGCFPTQFSYSVESRAPVTCPAGTYAAGIQVNVGAPDDWDQASLMCCGLSK